MLRIFPCAWGFDWLQGLWTIYIPYSLSWFARCPSYRDGIKRAPAAACVKPRTCNNRSWAACWQNTPTAVPTQLTVIIVNITPLTILLPLLHMPLDIPGYYLSLRYAGWHEITARNVWCYVSHFQKDGHRLPANPQGTWESVWNGWWVPPFPRAPGRPTSPQGTWGAKRTKSHQSQAYLGA